MQKSEAWRAWDGMWMLVKSSWPYVGEQAFSTGGLRALGSLVRAGRSLGSFRGFREFREFRVQGSGSLVLRVVIPQALNLSSLGLYEGVLGFGIFGF